jgi:hypothetical protein
MKKEFMGAGLCFAFVPFAIGSAVMTGKPLMAGLLWSVMPTVLGVVMLVKGLMKK